MMELDKLHTWLITEEQSEINGGSKESGIEQ